MRADENERFPVLANLSDKAIVEYNIALANAGLAESATSVETIFGTGSAKSPEESGEAFQKYKPIESLNPYTMHVLKFNPNNEDYNGHT